MTAGSGSGISGHRPAAGGDSLSFSLLKWHIVPARVAEAPGHQGVRMKRPLVIFAVSLLLPFTPPAFGQVPELNVTAICKARSGGTKLLQSGQAIEDCVRDEKAAKLQLSPSWGSTSVPVRKRCQSDARALGTTSYLDLLACIQISQDVKSDPKKAARKP
jgi:hypothetical protein